MLNLYTDPRFAHHLPGAVCFYAPPGDDDDDDEEDKEKGKGKGGGGGDGGITAAEAKKLRDDLDKWRKMSRKTEDANKALATEIAELKSKAQGGEQTEVDKLKERLDKAETDLQKTQLDALRLRVASRKGLTEAQAKRLQGTTEEELEEDADDLLESFPAKSTGDDDDDAGNDRSRGRGNGNGNGRERPREALKPGAKPNEKPEENDPEKLAADVPRL